MFESVIKGRMKRCFKRANKTTVVIALQFCLQARKINPFYLPLGIIVSKAKAAPSGSVVSQQRIQRRQTVSVDNDFVKLSMRKRLIQHTTLLTRQALKF